ncbi:plasmid stabilization protein [Pleurocapsa sp. CCALA 161]|uniref:type II toxin-antitoxin system RelE family toxin n=1 Tax=Pleurocapsa sp. CCALA 161 TaxID=2107688 RepID=UPI000D0826A7|nr:type II toxin-antitoxin system RelE/ParE family toxin [Pleurocapsa sp. CCALA 161]PSB12806.1 plasmid stabilization protein [Pleurocapsa sp. CCALA 161]
MQVEYRQLFLKDLKKLKKQFIYNKVFNLAFDILPSAEDLQNIGNVKAMKGYPNRYRIRIGDYRVGIEVSGDRLEVMRVLHRKEFYRYFP